jgi:hypothetical protein
MDLTTASPVEIDTALAEIYSRLYRVYDQIDRLVKFEADMDAGLAKFQAGDRSYSSFTQEKLDDLRAQISEQRRQAYSVKQETLPYESEFYRRGGWSRFFLVQNNGGHIHSSMGCSTCYPTTRFGWLPNLSGQTEAEAVAAHGAILCTVCYPSAPVEYTDRRDPSVCSGSGEFFNADQPHRTGYYSGNWATCPGCGTRQTVSKTGKIRKHKAQA